MQTLFAIIQKNLETDCVSIHSIYNDEDFAMNEVDRLIEFADGEYGYKLQAVGGKRLCLTGV